MISYLVINKRLSTSELQEMVGLKAYQFSVYRDRLKKKGLVDTSEYGKLSLSLLRDHVYPRKRISGNDGLRVFP